MKAVQVWVLLDKQETEKLQKEGAVKIHNREWLYLKKPERVE